MDKFAKRLQSRLSSKGYRFNKEQCRQALTVTAQNPELPTDAEMSAAFDYLTQPTEPETIEAESVSIQPSTFNLQAQEPEPEVTIPVPETFDIPVEDLPCLQPPEERPQPESGAIAPAAPQEIAQSSTTGISPAEVTAAINQAAQQVGVQGDAEAIEALTSLATILSGNNRNTQDMVAALVSAYLSERQRIFSSAIGTLNSLRSAQTESFQSGLDDDFFQQREQSKRQFLSKINAMFN